MFIIYSKSLCPWCVKAKALLKSKGLDYQEFLVGVDLTRNELLEIFPEAKTVPIILEDGSMIGGFTELQSHLNRKETDNAGSEIRTSNSSPLTH